MKVLITGANGFIGKNLQVRLKEEGISFITHTKENTQKDLIDSLSFVDFVVHLAGINRPKDEKEFKAGNSDLTELIAKSLQEFGNTAPVLYSSSIQVEQSNPYGMSKLKAENALRTLQKSGGNTIYNYRLPNVFGKWSRPNYNSVVSTFCYNILNNISIQERMKATKWPVTLMQLQKA